MGLSLTPALTLDPRLIVLVGIGIVQQICIGEHLPLLRFFLALKKSRYSFNALMQYIK